VLSFWGQGKTLGLDRIGAVVAGESHSLTVIESEEIYAWRSSNYGGLGAGDTKDRLIPTRMLGLARVKAIAAGSAHSLALTESGEVYAWGARTG
jgi:alpha-tubulin suppressor-like RCC1 family protein